MACLQGRAALLRRHPPVLCRQTKSRSARGLAAPRCAEWLERARLMLAFNACCRDYAAGNGESPQERHNDPRSALQENAGRLQIACLGPANES